MRGFFILECTPSFLKKYQKGTPRFLIAVPQPQVILERQSKFRSNKAVSAKMLWKSYQIIFIKIVLEIPYNTISNTILFYLYGTTGLAFTSNFRVPLKFDSFQPKNSTILNYQSLIVLFLNDLLPLYSLEVEFNFSLERIIIATYYF